jgi:hypothetical protein
MFQNRFIANEVGLLLATYPPFRLTPPPSMKVSSAAPFQTYIGPISWEVAVI